MLHILNMTLSKAIIDDNDIILIITSSVFKCSILLMNDYHRDNYHYYIK